MRRFRSWLQSANVWKRLSVRFLFFFVFLNLSDPLFDLALPPHHIRWQIGHILSLALVTSVVMEVFLSVTPKSPIVPELGAENMPKIRREVPSDPR